MPLPPIYDPEAVKPMWQELATVGVEPLTTPDQVDDVLRNESGTVLVIVNSVCGCAAGSARPCCVSTLRIARPASRPLPLTSKRTAPTGVQSATREFTLTLPFRDCPVRPGIG